MDEEALELLLIIPIIITVVAINATALEILGIEIDALENANETIWMSPFEYALDNSSGNVYPEVFDGG